MRTLALQVLAAGTVTALALWIYRWQERRRRLRQRDRDRLLARLSPRWLDDQGDRE